MENRRKNIEIINKYYFSYDNQLNLDDLPNTETPDHHNNQNQNIEMYRGSMDDYINLLLIAFNNADFTNAKQLETWNENNVFSIYNHILINNFINDGQMKKVVGYFVKFLLDQYASIIINPETWEMFVKIPKTSIIDNENEFENHIDEEINMQELSTMTIENKKDIQENGKKIQKLIESSFYQNFPNLIILQDANQYDNIIQSNQNQTDSNLIQDQDEFNKDQSCNLDELILCSFVVNFYFNKNSSQLIFEYCSLDNSNIQDSSNIMKEFLNRNKY